MRIEVPGQPWEKVLETPSQPIVDAVVLTCQTSNDENHQQENRGPDCHGQKGRTYLKKKKKNPNQKGLKA
jgi:hypothetical protein